jgi:tetratricopeptide (TPR) repeat protein
VKIKREVHMDKASFKKIIICSAIAGVIIGILQAVLDINLLTDYTVPYIIIIVIAVAAASVVISFNQWKRAMVLANEGKLDEAIQAFEKLHEKHKGKMGYKDQAVGGIANMYNRMGEFEKSNSYLEKINFDNLDNNTRAVSYAIYAHNLYFLDEDLYRARRYIKNSREMVEMPEFILLHALLELELEGQESSDDIIKQYERLNFNKKAIGGLYTILLVDEFSKKVNENFMLGLYYYKIGELNKAKEYLAQAADCSYENFFSDTAKELLKEL